MKKLLVGALLLTVAPLAQGAASSSSASPKQYPPTYDVDNPLTPNYYDDNGSPVYLAMDLATQKTNMDDNLLKDMDYPSLLSELKNMKFLELELKPFYMMMFHSRGVLQTVWRIQLDETEPLTGKTFRQLIQDAWEKNEQYEIAQLISLRPNYAPNYGFKRWMRPRSTFVDYKSLSDYFSSRKGKNPTAIDKLGSNLEIEQVIRWQTPPTFLPFIPSSFHAAPSARIVTGSAYFDALEEFKLIDIKRARNEFYSYLKEYFTFHKDIKEWEEKEGKVVLVPEYIYISPENPDSLPEDMVALIDQNKEIFDSKKAPAAYPYLVDAFPLETVDLLTQKNFKTLIHGNPEDDSLTTRIARVSTWDNSDEEKASIDFYDANTFERFEAAWPNLFKVQIFEVDPTNPNKAYLTRETFSKGFHPRGKFYLKDKNLHAIRNNSGGYNEDTPRPYTESEKSLVRPTSR